MKKLLFRLNEVFICGLLVCEMMRVLVRKSGVRVRRFHFERHTWVLEAHAEPKPHLTITLAGARRALKSAVVLIAKSAL